MESVSDFTLKLLGQCVELKILEISSNFLVTDVGIKALTKTVRNLSLVDVSRTSITDVSLRRFAKCCHALASLQVFDTKVIDILALKSCTSLRMLQIGGGVSKSATVKLQRALPLLQIGHGNSGPLPRYIDLQDLQS